MPPAGLVSLPEKLLLHICSFLPEDSLTSLSRTCSRLLRVLNSDAVWERFVSEPVRSLMSLKQLLNPDHQWGLDKTLCKNQQHLLRRNQLISNWKRGKQKQYSMKHKLKIDIDEVQFYKQNYMFVKTDRGIQFCDISKTPVLYPTRIKQSSQGEFGVRLFLVEDYLVVADSCVVNVYRIDVTNKEFPFLYSFAIKDENVVGGCVALEDGCVQKHDWEYRAEMDYLFCTQISSSDRFPILHIWNIVTGLKMGTFQAPVAGSVLVMESFADDNLLLHVKRGPVAFYFRLCMSTKTFSSTIFRLPFIFEHMTVRSFGDGYCLKYMRPRSALLLLETVNLNTSAQIAGRWFRNIHHVTEPNIVDDRLVLVYPSSFLVLDAISLETLLVVPHSTNEAYASVCLVSVFGSKHLLAVLKVGTIKVWDVDGKKCTLANGDQLTDRLGKLLTTSRVNWKGSRVYGNLPTKFVVLRERKIVVTSYW